jgi:flagellar motor switch protein FliM
MPLRAEVAIGALEARLFEHSELPGQFEAPACIEVLDAEPTGAYVFLQVDRRLVFVMIDRLLGGGRQPSPAVRRPLTEIETNLFQRLTESWSGEMSRWLSHNEPINLRSLRVESDPERVPCQAKSQTVLVEMSLRVADQTGRCRIGLPLAMATALQPLSPKDAALAENLPSTGIAVIAGNVRVRNDEAHRLKVGETVFADEALPRVYVNRKLMYTGRLGSNRHQKAVRIEDVVDGE